MSQLWGWLNELQLPVSVRPAGFKLYAWIFGCNLNECEPEDLKEYDSLGTFFYRKLKDGVRPIDEGAAIVSLRAFFFPFLSSFGSLNDVLVCFSRRRRN